MKDPNNPCLFCDVKKSVEVNESNIPDFLGIKKFKFLSKQYESVVNKCNYYKF